MRRWAKKSSRCDVNLCHYKLMKISGDLAGSTIWLGEYQTSKSMKRNLLD